MNNVTIAGNTAILGCKCSITEINGCSMMWANDGNINNVTIIGNITTSGRKYHCIVTVLNDKANTIQLLIVTIP